MKKVRWGIISTAKIGMEHVTPAMQRGDYSEVTAIASRQLAAAQEAAKTLGIPKAYGSYEAMLADPDIDAVYNPLPNHLHVPLSIQALEAGKHVLCEKPIAMDTAEAKTLLAAAKKYPHLKVMEAFMYRHHPQWQTAKRLVEAGKIGELRTINTLFAYYNVDPTNVRNMAGIGGGGLMDIGCYASSVPRFIFGEAPTRLVGLVEFAPAFQIDRLASAILDFGRGTATFTVSTQLIPYQRVNIFGTTGRIEVEIPFNAPNDRPCKLWLQQGRDIEEFTFDIVDHYTLQGDLFSQAILNDTPVFTPLEDAVANMKVIDAVFASPKSGGWVSL